MSRELFSLNRVFGELDAAGLASTADQHLRFNNNAATQLFGNCFCLACGSRYASLRDRNAISGKDLFGLIFMQFHAISLVLD